MTDKFIDRLSNDLNGWDGSSNIDDAAAFLKTIVEAARLLHRMATDGPTTDEECAGAMADGFADVKPGFHAADDEKLESVRTVFKAILNKAIEGFDDR